MQYVYIKEGFYCAKSALAQETGRTQRVIRKAVEHGLLEEIRINENNVRIVPKASAEKYLEWRRRQGI